MKTFPRRKLVVMGKCLSTMADHFELGLDLVLRRMSTVNGDSQVVSAVGDGTATAKRSFAKVSQRAGAAARALQALGLTSGDRVGTLSWNTVEHLELYLAVPCAGFVLHTANPRLTAEQLAFTVNDAGDRVLIFDHALAELVREVLPQLRTVEKLIQIGGRETLPGALNYEEFLKWDQSPEWPTLHERDAAALCYTSGTTGDPKGVAYSHRSLVLHALAMQGGDAFRVAAQDRVLVAVPMFHAMAWNIPFVCGLNGADLVLPSRFVQPDKLVNLIEIEGVTHSLGVPTIWSDVYQHTAATPARLATLNTVVCGGSSVPDALVQKFRRTFDCELVQGWGMTETLPGAALVGPQRSVLDGSSNALRRESAGRITPLYEMRVMTPEGEAPWDGGTVGEIEVRGPIVTTAYHGRSEVAERFGGWLATGDVGCIDSSGWLFLTDRTKDVIKSGGEWISSVELEAILVQHPDITESAVVARPEARWGERPYAFVKATREILPDEFRSLFDGHVPSWWVPDEFEQVSDIPRTSVGKLDKKLLRAILENR